MLDSEKKKLNIYLDNCCYNRPYDDQTQLRVELETKAKLFIQTLIEEDQLDLMISYISDLENEVNPYQDRKSGISDFFRHAKYDIDENDEVLATAMEIEDKGVKPKDALHVSCAIHSGCEYFITTDDKLRKCKESRIKLMSPMRFMEIWEEKMMNEATLMQTGMQILIKNLGNVEAERFVSTFKRNTFDYTEWQRGLFDGMSVEDISKRAMELRAEKQK